jgi:glyceraldehyde 3-phosphate dehydrogenase
MSNVKQENTLLDVDQSLELWREKEKKALYLLKLVGEIRFDRSVELILFRRDIYDARPSQVINDHLFAENYVNKPITLDLSIDIVKAIMEIDQLGPSRIDIGKLAAGWLESRQNGLSLLDFIQRELSDVLSSEPQSFACDVVLYGFGRIGRLAARRLISMTGKGDQLRLKAIVIRPQVKDKALELQKRASLLRKDSVHGKFRGIVDVDVENETLIVNGNRIKIIFAQKPTDIDYTDYGIEHALLIDNTGVWSDKEGLSQHLRPGIAQVLFTAPGKGIPNIVHGVNHHTLNVETDNIYSAASCTTNAIVPVLKVIDDQFGIDRGHIETVHAYTNDQNLMDNFHRKPRRGRAAAINMVITSTGAASAVSKVLPQLHGKLTGNAVRVPIPNVSLAILALTVKKGTTVDEVNEVLKAASLNSDLVEQIKFSLSNDFVSSDAVGTTHPAIFDAPSTIVSEDGHQMTLYVWYDNEYGYTCQVLRLAKYAARVRRPFYY